MIAQERSDFIKEFIDKHCYAMLRDKGQEYSRGEEDVNSNFKRVAAAIGSDPLTVAYVYLAKHFDSISYYIKTGENPSNEPIEGRIGDAINYLLILAALIEEGRNGSVDGQDEMSEGSRSVGDSGQPGVLQDSGDVRDVPHACLECALGEHFA